MKTYHVKVAIQILEIYAIETDDPETAADDWSCGELIHRCDEALDTVVLSVEEQQP